MQGKVYRSKSHARCYYPEKSMVYNRRWLWLFCFWIQGVGFTGLSYKVLYQHNMILKPKRHFCKWPQGFQYSALLTSWQPRRHHPVKAISFALSTTSSSTACFSSSVFLSCLFAATNIRLFTHFSYVVVTIVETTISSFFFSFLSFFFFLLLFFRFNFF